jgi:hypothetical protein
LRASGPEKAHFLFSSLRLGVSVVKSRNSFTAFGGQRLQQIMLDEFRFVS